MRTICFSMIFFHQLCFCTLSNESRKENYNHRLDQNCIHDFKIQIEAFGFKDLKFVAKCEYGWIYSGINHKNKNKQAIKVSKSKSSTENEIKILKELRYINIIELLHIERKNSMIYMFFNFYDNTLLKFVLNNKINQLKKKIIIKQLLDVLVYLKEKQIIHNDLNPNNIMIQSKYTVQVIDFSISCSSNSTKNFMPSKVAHEDTGKYFHYSPEIRNLQQNFDEKTDIWSLGCVIYFIETKKVLSKYILEEDLHTKYREFISYFIHIDPIDRISAEIARISDFFDDIYDNMFCFCSFGYINYFLGEVQYVIENNILRFQRNTFYYQIYCINTCESVSFYTEKISVLLKNNQNFIEKNPHFKFSTKCSFLVSVDQIEYMLYELPIDHFCVVFQAFQLLKTINKNYGN